jgi:hypothetical protein
VDVMCSCGWISDITTYKTGNLDYLTNVPHIHPEITGLSLQEDGFIYVIFPSSSIRTDI